MSSMNGPVPIGSDDYINRAFEATTLAFAIKREWVLMLGPRQHGKTSALLRIRDSLIDSGFRCAFVDLQAMPSKLNINGLIFWFAKKISESLGVVISIDDSVKIDTLEGALQLFIPMPGPPVVILVDEASAIEDEADRNSFYGQIRSLKTAAAAASDGELSKIIQFVFAGTFRPETLVAEKNSPFNVCERVDTEDLTKEQVIQLATVALKRNSTLVEECAGAIYSKVGGQPHLVQSFLNMLTGSEQSSELSIIESGFNRLLEQGSEHITSIFKSVIQDVKLLNIARDAVNYGSVPNDPANVDLKYIGVLGLMRRDGQTMYFRNQLYAEVAKLSSQLRPEVIRATNLAPLYQLQESNFTFVTDAQFREIACSAYNGAVVLANAAKYRLALVGYGSALEALLMDFLVALSNADLTAAIAAVPVSKNLSFKHFEKRSDPKTWRLVNLMHVGRAIHRVSGALELPDALRDLRNYVHPAVIKTNYMTEAELLPEVKTCGGLVDAVIRELQR